MKNKLKNSFTQHHFNINQELRKRIYPRTIASKNGVGFTLLEAIFAISILMLTLGGAFALIQQTIASTPIIHSKLIASYLAQEGIEVIRNIRDTNWLEDNNWNVNLTDITSYNLDYQSSEFPDPNCTAQYLCLDGNFYNCRNVGSQTQFQRSITLGKLGAEEIEILVEVSWQERGRTHEVKTMEHLYNWR
ncbi:hypothetical protein AMJ49_02475 [Parcubacteria bacterium DG_74_2]|nr:MAG: hypothetical protein AMJ49_02475 [Parcubacteria bacterium DG_74_2]